MLKRILFILVFLGGLVPSASAAIAHGTAVGCDSTATGSVTTMTCNPDVSGSNKILYCAVLANDVTDINPAAVYNITETMTLIKESSGTGTYLAVFRLIAPSDGVGVGVVFTSLSGSVRDAGVCVNYTGVDQSTPNDTENLVETASNTVLSSGTITNPAGDVIFGALSKTGTGAPSVTGGGNSLILATGTSGNNGYVAIAEDVDGADDTMDWSIGVNAAMSAITFNVNAVAAAGGSNQDQSGTSLGVR